MTATPSGTPAGRSTVTFTAEDVVTRHRLYRYGDHDKCPNPGDMLIVSVVGDGRVRLTTEIYIRGSEVSRFAETALACAAEYDAEAYWLNEPVTRTVGGAA